MRAVKYQNENFGGSFDFRCRWHDGFFVEAHLHGYSELLYAKQGAAEITVGGRPCRIPEGYFIFIPPNCLHEYACRTEVICAVFSGDLIPLFFKALAGRYLIPEPTEAAQLKDTLEKLPLLSPQDPVLLSGYLNLICAQVLKNARFDSHPPTDSLLYQQVMTYLSAHYAENITLKTLADKFGYNEKYLSHSLHTLTGMNFRRLLSLYRVEHAKQLLTGESKSISDIALASGFSALNTFNRVFKSFTSQSPSQYRKTHP